jgi:hypothetical protein
MALSYPLPGKGIDDDTSQTQRRDWRAAPAAVSVAAGMALALFVAHDANRSSCAAITAL